MDKVIGAAARTRALVERQLGACRAAIAPPATPESTLHLQFNRGDRVVHITSGQEGTILRGERRPALVAAPQSFDV